MLSVRGAEAAQVIMREVIVNGPIGEREYLLRAVIDVVHADAEDFFGARDRSQDLGRGGGHDAARRFGGTT